MDIIFLFNVFILGDFYILGDRNKGVLINFKNSREVEILIFQVVIVHSGNYSLTSKVNYNFPILLKKHYNVPIFSIIKKYIISNKYSPRNQEAAKKRRQLY